MKKIFLILAVLAILLVLGIFGIINLDINNKENIDKEDINKAPKETIEKGEGMESEINITTKIQPEIKREEIPVKKSFPVLKNLGVNIDVLNKQTNLAGDLIFSKKLLFEDQNIKNEWVFVEFGAKGQRKNDLSENIEYWFHVPLKTKVIAPVDGKVQVVFFEHTKDWGVNFMEDGSSWIVSFEHVVNLVVKDGQMVKVGDIIGEAAPRSTFNNEIAMTELAVWMSGSGIVKYCPFLYLDESLKSIYKNKINKVAADWEEYIGKDVYEQDKWIAPGCLVESIVEK